MMAIDINPTCYTTPGTATYSKPIGDLYAKNLIHKAVVCIEIDSVGSPGTPVVPRNGAEDLNQGGNSQRTLYIRGQRIRYLDETFLAHAATGLQGGLMFQIAEHVQHGLLRVRDAANLATVRTPAQIISYAITGAWA